MEWTFGPYRLNANRAELIGPDGPVHVERTPLEVLIHLIQNAERVVTKAELVDAIWGGRIVSEATVSTAIKQARRAVADNGTEQNIIRTLHGRGFCFVADFKKVPEPAPVSIREASDPPALERLNGEHGTGQPGIAVLRFAQFGSEPSASYLAKALPAEIISGLSRVRWLHVIARGSAFQFDPEQAVPEDVGARLGVRFLMTGVIEVVGEMLSISVEIQSTNTGMLVWSDVFTLPVTEIQTARQQIVPEVIAALELSIPRFEADRARILRPAQFDAWSYFHVGLSHMYRFDVASNRIAAEHFRTAIEHDDEFARAHAGLSFTHWQNAFMRFGDDRSGMIDRAFQSASAAVEIDATDPFASFNMGRALWLQGDIDGAHAWLDRAIEINPNYAQCHYNKGLILTLDGEAADAASRADKALSLSPLDPLAYAMHAVRAMTLISLERFDEASQCADKAMRSPGSHFYIALIAAAAAELSGDQALAERRRNQVIHQRPDFEISAFFAAFPFRDPDLKAKLSGALQRLGLPS